MQQRLIQGRRRQQRHHPEFGRQSRKQPRSERGGQQQQSMRHGRPEPQPATIAEVVDDDSRNELHEQHQRR